MKGWYATAMLLHRHLAVLMAALVLLLVPGCNDSKEEEAVRAVFDTWLEACDSADADAFVSRVDPGSIARCDEIVRLARTGTRKQLQALEAQELGLVVAMRNRLSLEEMKGMDGAAMLRWSVSSGQWARRGDMSLTMHLENLQFSGARASGTLFIEEFETRLRFSFTKAGGPWQLELDAALATFSRLVERIAERSGLKIETLLLKSEERSTGSAPRKDILDVPPKD